MIRRRRRDEGGAVAVLVVAISMVLFGFAALVVDLGHARDARRHSQNASDSAALAAGNALYASGTRVPDVPGAVAAAQRYAAENFDVPPDAWSTCSDPARLLVPAGSTACISFAPTLAQPTEVRVRMPTRVVPLPLAGALGLSEAPITTLAHARVELGGAAECGLCILGEGSTHDLQNGDAIVHGANIHFNGNVNVGANGLVATDGEITVQGTATGPQANYTPTPTTNAPPITDPLARVPLPPDLTGLVGLMDPCTQGPGVYGAQNLRNRTCTLQPGLYVIAGGPTTTWDVAGNASTLLRGTGVTLYFTCGTSSAPRECSVGEQGANLDASGNGTLSLQAPTSGATKGFAIVYDRNNSALMRLTGNGSQNTTGTIYATSGTLQLNGNGCSNHYYALIVVRDLEMNGNPACLQSTYTQGQNVEVPPGELHLSR